MNFSLISSQSPLWKLFNVGKVLLLTVIATLGIVSCGGGGGGDDDENVIAPRSLEGVTIRLFNAFDMEFIRRTGVRDNESGAVVYARRANSFFLATSGQGGGAIGYPVALPVALADSKYTYLRTGENTGRITITFRNGQAYPWPNATAMDPGPNLSQGDMFWGGPEFTATELILDVLFVNSGGFLTVNTTRVRSAYRFLSEFTAGAVGTAGAVVNTVIPVEFDTIDAQLSLFSGRLPTGYDFYDTFDENAPTRNVWTSLTTRTVNFVGTDLTRRIAFRNVLGVGPAIPGVQTPDESGTLLADDANGTLGAEGTYSYARTGKDGAKLTLNYRTMVLPETVPPSFTPVTVTYTLIFESTTDGSFTDSNGATGRFTQVLFSNL